MMMEALTMKREKRSFPNEWRIDFLGIHKKMKQAFVQAIWFGLLIAGGIYIWDMLFEAMGAQAHLWDISAFLKG